MIATGRLYLLLFAGLALFCLSPFLPVAQPFGITLDVIILLLVAIDWQFTPRAKLFKVERKCEDRLSIGRHNTVQITVAYDGNTPVRCVLRDDAPQMVHAFLGRIDIAKSVETFAFTLAGQSARQLEYALFPLRRGAYVFGPISLRYTSFLGLFQREIVFADQARPVKVFSDLKALRDLSIKLSHSNELGELAQRKRGQGTDFSALREYAIGDDSKAVDWNATARRDRPVVRTYEAEQDQRMTILIDAGRMMVSDLDGLTRYDRALNAALCLAMTGLHHNDQVGIGIFADKPLLYLPPKRGKSQMTRILEATFPIEPKMVEPDYVSLLAHFAACQKGRSLIVVLTDLTDAYGSQALLNGLARLSPRHLPFCVTLKDKSIETLAVMPIREMPQKETQLLYKRAAAIDLKNQRELALSHLQRRGCVVLDSAPQDLSTRIVDSYLDLKARARL